MSYDQKMDFSCSIEFLGHFQSLAKLLIFLDFFGTFFLYLKNRLAYQFAGENLQNWILPAQKALAPKFLGKTVLTYQLRTTMKISSKGFMSINQCVSVFGMPSIAEYHFFK